MNKKSIIIISILSLIIFGLIGGIIYINNYYNKQLDYIFYTNVDENFRAIEYDCSFTKTYRVADLLDGYIAEVPEWSYIAADGFQNHNIIALRIPSTLKTNLQQGKYYEFTYIIKGKDKTIKTMEDVNTYLVLNDSNAEFKITLDIKETDKQGLEQVQENICVPK